MPKKVVLKNRYPALIHWDDPYRGFSRVDQTNKNRSIQLWCDDNDRWIQIRYLDLRLKKQVVEENSHMAIMWHIGRATLFGRGTPDSFAFDRPVGNFWASKWTLWLSTNGQSGIEPPDEIKKLDKLWDKFSLYASDSREAVEVGGEYYSFFAEQLPVISTVGLIPQPVIFSNRLGNIPTENMYWGSDNNFYAPFHIEQWYIKN